MNPVLSDDSVYNFNLNKRVFTANGDVTVPIVIDLSVVYSVCNKTVINDELSHMFMSEYSDIRRRNRRFLATILLGASVAMNVWQGVSYSGIENEVRNTVNTMKDGLISMQKIIMRNVNANIRSFILIKKEMRQLRSDLEDNVCRSTMNLLNLIVDNRINEEFNAIIQSLKDERLGSTILPLKQVHQLVDAIYELRNTVYTRYPYLVYQYGKIQMDVSEVRGNILRGVLILPIIHSMDDVLLRVVHHVNDDRQAIIFDPLYVSEKSGKDLRNCISSIEFYLCSNSDYVDPVYKEMKDEMVIKDGIIILNSGVELTAYSSDEGETVLKGPYVGTQNSFRKVIYKGKIIHVSASAFVISRYLTDLDTLGLNAKFSSVNDSMFYDNISEMYENRENIGKVNFGDVMQTTALNSCFSISMILLCVGVYYMCKWILGKCSNAKSRNTNNPILVTTSNVSDLNKGISLKQLMMK